jgi:hypothetical protein
LDGCFAEEEDDEDDEEEEEEEDAEVSSSSSRVITSLCFPSLSVIFCSLNLTSGRGRCQRIIKQKETR